MNVLLVDDDESVDVLLRRALRQNHDLHLHSCTRSGQAMALVLALKPVLILQDLNMPEGSGLDLLAEYRRQDATRDIPVIILSSNEDPAVKSRSFAMGANDYMVKLPDEKEVIARIRYHIQAYLNLLELRSLQADLLRQNVVLEETVRDRTAELASQMKRFEASSRAGRVALWDWDIRSGALEWPSMVDALLGYGQGEFPRTNAAWVEVVHPDDSRRFQAAVDRHLVEGLPYQEEYRVRRKDGSYIWVRDTGECARDAGGSPVRMLGACVDITEIRKVEDAVRESEYRYRTLVDSMAEGVVLVNSNRAVAAANAAAERILGRSREKLLGCLADDPFPDTVREDGTPFSAGNHPAASTLRTGEPLSDVVMGVRRPDGGRVWISVNTRALVHQGETAPYAAVVTFHDVTRQRDAEHLRVAKEAAEMSNRAKSAFLANMSHELRTPLNAVIGFSDMLEQEHFGPLNDKQKEYVHDICASGRHLLSLINDILDLSKIEAGKMEPEWSVVNVGDLLSNSTVYVREKCHKHGISLGLEIEEAVRGLAITADERRMKQVMYNLLSNAAKFTPDGGSIRIAARLRRGGEEDAAAGRTGAVGDPVWIEVTVEDTGIGIPRELHAKVFEEFYQVKREAFNKTPGTGLGLALVRQFVAMHGGRVWVESEGLGCGSRFTFTIPVDGDNLPGQRRRGDRRRGGAAIEGGTVHDVIGRAITAARADRRPFVICGLRVGGVAGRGDVERISAALDSIKRSDDVVVSEHGEAFFVVLRDCSPDDGRTVSARFAERLEAAIDRQVQCMTASYPDDGRTVDAILRRLCNGKDTSA
jgi:PAS domain S-box-containing protein